MTTAIWNPVNIEIYKQAMLRPSNVHKKEAMMIVLMKMQALNSK